MRKLHKIFALLTIALVGIFQANAQTDVTSTYLTNANFDTTPLCFTKAGGAVLQPGATRIGTTGYIYNIPGWTNASVITANAAQVATGEYGTVANALGFNTVPAPTADINGGTAGACIFMSGAWGSDQARYYQTVTLPEGKYVMKVEAYNAHTTLTIVNNYFGFIPDAGTATFMTKKSFASKAWVKDSVSFYLGTTTTGKINIGLMSSPSGSANGAKIFFDNVKLIYYGIDKTGLKALVDSANVMIAHPQAVGALTVYADLATAVSNAQAVYSNVSASAANVVAQETAMKSAIANVYSAITLQSRTSTWTVLPYNATSVITNASFESDLSVGWTNVGGFARQTNTSIDPKKEGATYSEKWMASPGTQTNLKLSQTITNIPNGIYIITAATQAIQQTAPVAYPGGAFIIANSDSTEVFAINDYTVQTTVTNNTLTLGFKVNTSGNWVALDNFRLSYLGAGSPFLLIAPTTQSFTPANAVKTVNIKGAYLTSDVSLATTPNFTVSRTTIPAAEVMATGGVNVDVTSIATGELANDSLIITTGAVRQKVSLSTSETLSPSNYVLTYDQSTANERAITITGDVYHDVQLTAPAGVSLSATTATKAEALAGKSINVTWDKTSTLNNQYIHITSGSKKDSILVLAVAHNLISAWDGDTAVVVSKPSDFGWTQTDATGAATATVFNSFATTGVRYVTIASAAHTYRGKAMIGDRVVYLRTWGSPAANVYNLQVNNLEAGVAYVFRGMSAWHNNETNPTFTYAVNSLQSNLGDTLGIKSVACTVKQQGENYGFEFTPKVGGTHYLTVSSNTINDVMCAPEYLAIYRKDLSTGIAPTTNLSSAIQVYPTITNGSVNVNLKDKNASIRVFDLSGKLVSESKNASGITNIRLPKSGAYIVKVNSATESRTVKVIKVN